MASSLRRSLKRLGINTVSNSSSTAGGLRSFSASIRRCQDDSQKSPQSQPSDEASTPSTGAQSSGNNETTRTDYQPPSSSRGSWPFESNSSDSDSTASSSSTSNPYAGLFDGPDPFPKTFVPKLGSTTPSPSSTTNSSTSEKGNWLSDQLDSLSSSSSSSTRPSRPRYETPDGRRKHPIPRSVLFADSEPTRQSEDFRPRKPPSSASTTRKRFDRTPLTQQEANAFMSLLNQALASTSIPTSTSSASSSSLSNLSSEQGGWGVEQTPFGSYTSLISNPKTQSGSKALLQAFAKRNRLQRFEEAKAQRAKRFVREGLAAEVDPLELEAGIDEARERIAMCENLGELFDWAKKEVWGIIPPTPASTALSESAPADSEAVEQVNGPKYGKDTPFYASVLQLLFVAIRDRYRSPHVALSIPRVTRSLGIESYVLGVTGGLYNEVLKTQWDWLGDLQGVVSTLRQARETGILSAPQKYSAIAPSAGEDKKLVGFASSEDETIRESVDRIANEVRKYVLDQRTPVELGTRRGFVYDDVLTGEKGVEAKDKGKEEGGEMDWSQRWLLANAEEASTLAGQPFRLLQKQMREKDRAERGGRFGRFAQEKGGFGRDRYDGASGSGERRSSRPFNKDGYQGREGGYQGRDGKGSSRYSASGSFGARTSRSRPPSDQL